MRSGRMPDSLSCSGDDRSADRGSGRDGGDRPDGREGEQLLTQRSTRRSPRAAMTTCSAITSRRPSPFARRPHSAHATTGPCRAAKIVESRLDTAAATCRAFSHCWRPADCAKDPRLAVSIVAMTRRAPPGVDDVRSAHLRLVQENAGDQRRTTSEQLAQARVLLGESDPGGAFDILSTVLNDVDSSRDPATSAQGWLLLSRASHVLGRTDEAAIALGRAIDLSEPEDNRRVVLDAGTFSPSLIVHYRSRIDSSWPFLDELVQVALTPVTAAASPLAPVIEPLSHASGRARIPAQHAHVRGDRFGVVHLCEHDEEPRAQHLSQARCRRSTRCGEPGATAPPAPLVRRQIARRG